MNPIEQVWTFLKMGVTLPKEAIGPFPSKREDDEEDEEIEEYHTPSRSYRVPKEVGRYPDNPGDPHHGFGVEPWWSEGGKQGYHPHAEETAHLGEGEGGKQFEAENWKELEGQELGGTRQEAMMQALGLIDEDEPKSQMHQQIQAPAEIDDAVSSPEGMSARDMFQLSGANLQQIIELANAEVARRKSKKEK